MFDKFVSAADRAIRRTSTDAAPWHIVEGRTNATGRSSSPLSFATIRRGLERSVHATHRLRAANRRTRVDGPVSAVQRVEREFNVLDNLDLSQKLSDDEFDHELARLQARSVCSNVEQGSEACRPSSCSRGGCRRKGGAIRRLTGSLDARTTRSFRSAPRRMRNAPIIICGGSGDISPAGRITIFDRSWYGRVLVERVEGFAAEAEHMRGYGEITQFEEQLVTDGILLVKFWIHISKVEQLTRFRDRSRTSYKRWKITEEDWRNRKRWDDYTVAVNDMVARTSTKIAPWTLVEGNDKNFARIKVLGTVADRLADRVKK